MPPPPGNKTPPTEYFQVRPATDVPRLLRFQLAHGHLTEKGELAARNFLREMDLPAHGRPELRRNDHA